MNYKLLLNFALLTGEIMLENGAETFRVEDTIARILHTSNCQTAESFVTPTGIFVTLDHSDIDLMTIVRRIKKRSINLNKIEQSNSISRKYCNHSLTLESAMYQMTQVKNASEYRTRVRIASTGFAAGFFALVFGGGLSELVIAFLCGISLGFLETFLSKLDITKFFIDIIGGFLIALLPFILLKLLGFRGDYDLIVISSIMPMVPGVAITNGIRDTLHGELISGVARIADAFITAISIAIGVGFALILFV